MVRKAVAAPVKKAVPRKRAAAKKKRAPSKKAREAAMFKWSAAYGAPIMMLQGWDPETGEWHEESPIGKMLIDMVLKGTHLGTAARRHDVRRVGELVSKGSDYMADEEMSEERMLVPLDIRPFVDLALLVSVAEAEAETNQVEVLYKAGLKNARDALAYLARRFPTRWRDQQDVVAELERDPREAAMDKLMEDPNAAMQMAELAHRAAKIAVDTDPDRL